MLKQDQSTVIAGRSVGEILKRFNDKIKDPKKNQVKVKEFQK